MQQRFEKVVRDGHTGEARFMMVGRRARDSRDQLSGRRRRSRARVRVSSFVERLPLTGRLGGVSSDVYWTVQLVSHSRVYDGICKLTGAM